MREEVSSCPLRREEQRRGGKTAGSNSVRVVVYEKVRLTQDFRNFDFLSPWEAMTSLPGDEKAHRDKPACRAELEGKP